MSAPTPFPPQWSVASPVPVGWMRQFHYFVGLFDRISNVSGDVVECGLGEGNTFCMLAYLAGSESLERPRKLWGFDSFQGWPEPAEHDKSFRNPQKGEWKVEEKDVWDRLKFSKINEEFPNLEIEIIPGFFSESLPGFPDQQIAFLHADADLYPSYCDVLNNLFSKVAKGGIVLFDEYKEFHPEGEKWPGATKAIDDYFQDLPYEIQHHEETDKYYVIKQ